MNLFVDKNMKDKLKRLERVSKFKIKSCLVLKNKNKI